MNIFEIYKLSKSENIEDKQKALEALNNQKSLKGNFEIKKFSKNLEIILTIVILGVINYIYFTKLDFQWYYIIIVDIIILFLLFVENHKFNISIKDIVLKNNTSKSPINTIINNPAVNDDIERIKSKLK